MVNEASLFASFRAANKKDTMAPGMVSRGILLPKYKRKDPPPPSEPEASDIKRAAYAKSDTTRNNALHGRWIPPPPRTPSSTESDMKPVQDAAVITNHPKSALNKYGIARLEDKKEEVKKEVKKEEVKKEEVKPEQAPLSDASTDDPHSTHTRALKQSHSVLKSLDKILLDNSLFCSSNRRTQLRDEINACLEKTAPDTIIGVLGASGVGKSSLLNALLDEASVLPTSGSRGCTAAVVELRYNKNLVEPAPGSKIPLYKGTVEFISLAEWQTELKYLVEECSDHKAKKIYSRLPDGGQHAETAAAWSKINQVYGRGTMERHKGLGMDVVYQGLANDARVVDLLTPNKQGMVYKSESVQEGEVHTNEAYSILQPVADIPRRLRRQKKKAANAFRHKINEYVYRRGDGSSPQSWPLIRKVVLEGPWQVLSSGACMVCNSSVRCSLC